MDGNVKHQFSVVIPTRNERRNIPQLNKYLALFQEIIFVDGNSTDGTPDTIEELYPKAKIISQGVFKGKGSAILIGLEHVTGDYVVVLDADAPVSLNEIESVMEFCNKNLDIDLIKGSRHLDSGGSEDLTFIRAIGAKSFALLCRLLFRVDWTEMCYGFWTIKIKSLKSMELQDILKNRCWVFPFEKIPYGQSFEFDQVVFLRALKLNLRICEIPSFELSRKQGKSSLFAPRDGLRTLLVICKEFFRHA